MEWNDGIENGCSEHTNLQLSRVTGVAQYRLNYLVGSLQSLDWTGLVD